MVYGLSFVALDRSLEPRKMRALFALLILNWISLRALFVAFMSTHTCLNSLTRSEEKGLAFSAALSTTCLVITRYLVSPRPQLHRFRYFPMLRRHPRTQASQFCHLLLLS